MSKTVSVGAIILSKTSSVELYGHTTRTIMTLANSLVSDNFKIVIVETNFDHQREGFIYPTLDDRVYMVYPETDFNYNLYLNYGLENLGEKFDWYIVSNNDVVYHPKWWKRMMQFSKNHPEFGSLSPYEPNWHPKRGIYPGFNFKEGYRPAFEITGWCLAIKKSTIDICDLFDPDFEYWYQDNDYALTLQKFNVKHALVEKSRVYHTISASLEEIEAQKKYHMTDGQIEVLKRKWGPNV